MMTLNHGLSGYVVARAATPLVRRWSPLPAHALGWAGFLGAMLPDLDVVSSLLGPGIYRSGAWYAHRVASHSVLGALVLAVLAATVLYRPLLGRAHGWRRASWLWLAGAFWVGALLHLVGDMVTPGWGLPLAWPFEGRWGGYATLGWFSPYLLWMFLVVLALDTGALLWRRWQAPPAWMPRALWAVHVLAAYRWVQYMATSRYESSRQWAEYQATLLPDALNGPIGALVHTLWHVISR